jgi:hypothetical protein
MMRAGIFLYIAFTLLRPPYVFGFPRFPINGSVDGEYFIDRNSSKLSWNSSAKILVNTVLYKIIFRFENDFSFIYTANMSTSYNSVVIPFLPLSSVELSFFPEINQLRLEIKGSAWNSTSSLVFHRDSPALITHRYCHEGNAFLGRWSYGKHNETVPPFIAELEYLCPLLVQTDFTDLRMGVNNHPIPRTPSIVLESFFYPYDDCYSLPFQKSVAMYQKLTGKDFPLICMTGDSLGRQIHTALRCNFEFLFHRAPDVKAEIIYQWQPYLRADFPCAECCPDHPNYVNNTVVHGSATVKPKCKFCGNCRIFKKNVNISRNGWIENKHLFSAWVSSLPPDLELLLLDCGAWYATYEGMSNSNVEYLELLTLLKPHLHALMQSRPHLSIFWIGLPPMITLVNPDYDHQEFSERNKMAKALFSTIGITYIDVENFASERKVRELSMSRERFSHVSGDHLHWYGPGSFSIPSMIVERILHLFVMKLLSEQRGKTHEWRQD